jgi:glucose/arabinose dehydrogenase
VLSIAWSETGTACVGEAGSGVRCVEPAPPHRVTARGDARQIRAPAGLLFAGDGVLYVADEAGRVWRLGADGTLTAIAGGGPGF